MKCSCRQCGIRSLPKASTDGRGWDLNRRPLDLGSEALAVYATGSPSSGLVDRCFLASFTAMKSLVRSYISTTNLSSRDIDSSLTSSGMSSSSLKVSVTSGKAAHVSYAVFFPLPENADTVSHPVRAWKMERVVHFLGSIVEQSL